LALDVLDKRYRAYLFDLDGTLIDSAPDINSALNAALSAAALPPVDERLTRHWVGYGSRVLLEQAFKHHGVADRLANEPEMARLFRVFIDHYSRHIADASRLYPGVAEALRELSARGARLGVVTNKLAGLSHQLLEAVGLQRFFGAVVCGDSLPQRKPDPAPALLACRLLDALPHETLFVGDSTTDVETARNAGCAIVCVRDGYNHGVAPEALGADALVDSLLDLVARSHSS
jgi:phosphoglycolate phosphatase